MKKLNQKGFTLIEMMIVLIVVSVLTLLILPNASTYITKANTEGCAAYKSSLTSQAIATQLTHGSIPGSLTPEQTNNLVKVCGPGTYGINSNGEISHTPAS
ncbi:competence type IV pilus major pilin ComGC [Turicibacter sanguinis]|uniref:competence type IV pilus major pilin ComGC n=1 Tax=Turicibacter sanguinis TaxID=154288 RepID=UPI0018AC4B21|nr:prepilin-type N-terminal cleavage/methylation domain-containing protein [Turicibacter sanguinis]MDB8551201.1 prepilin-type N-terminal cleavage/methylation domain-containing protein [Turicibacter sanguinis]